LHFAENYEGQRKEIPMMQKLIKAVILFLLLVPMGCARKDRQLAAHFDQIKVGDSRDSLINGMGQPMERGYSDFLGLSRETLTWCEDGETYEIVMINDYVIAKKMAPVRAMRCR
jgi:hypothetical protein